MQHTYAWRAEQVERVLGGRGRGSAAVTGVVERGDGEDNAIRRGLRGQGAERQEVSGA